MTNSMIEYNWNSLGEGSLNGGRKEVRGKEGGKAMGKEKREERMGKAGREREKCVEEFEERI